MKVELLNLLKDEFHFWLFPGWFEPNLVPKPHGRFSHVTLSDLIAILHIWTNVSFHWNLQFLKFTLTSLDIQTINEDETSGIAFPNACAKETLPGQIFEMQGQTVHSECKYILDKISHNF